MKILFFSDLHGDANQAEKIIEAAADEKADYLIGSGDFLYHGPRNTLPADYATAAVVKTLNACKDKIIGCRGNCDSEVDQMVLAFPMMSDFTTVLADGKRFFITHGHLYNAEQLPDFLTAGDIFVQGHTHVAMLKKNRGIWTLNPGSTALPRGKEGPSYAIYEQGVLSVKLLESRTIFLEEHL